MTEAGGPQPSCIILSSMIHDLQRFARHCGCRSCWMTPFNSRSVDADTGGALRDGDGARIVPLRMSVFD